jgi:5-methylthioadenosine/S-adenosylhomocysteine deaminase
MDLRKADLIVDGRFVLASRLDEIISYGSIVVLDDKIADVGPTEKIAKRWTAKEVIHRPYGILSPGFVNTHTHAPMVFFRGMADDLPLDTWLKRHIWPAESTWLSPEFVRDATALAMIEMIRSGTVLYNDMYFYLEESIPVLEKTGMNAVLGMGVFDFPSKMGDGPEDYLKRAKRMAERFKGHPHIKVAICPHATYTCSPNTLSMASGLAKKMDLLLHTHASENTWEVEEVSSRYGFTPIELLEIHGVLEGPTILAHVVRPSEKEIEILVERKTGVSLCIQSNLKLGNGIAPAKEMAEKGVLLSIGTDGAASNNNLHMLEEVTTLALVQKGVSGDPSSLPAKEMLKMATWNGAKALLFENTGSIEVGKRADIVVFDASSPHLTPIYDPLSHLVYAANSGDISDVVLGGKVVMRERKIEVLEEDEVLDKARWWGERIAKWTLGKA